MGLINYIVTKLFYCVSIFMFIHTFFEYAGVTWKRIFAYSMVGAGILLFGFYWMIPLEYATAALIMCIFFMVFDGRIMSKICIGILAQSVWYALHLLNNIIFGDMLLYAMRTQNGKNVALDLFSMVMMSLCIYILEKESVFDIDMNRRSEFSIRQQISMIILTLEGDIIFLIAAVVFRNQLNIIFDSTVLSIVLCIGGFYMICFALSIDNSISKEHYQMINQTLKEQIKSQLAYYQKLERVTKETRAIKHDMKNHLIVLKGLADENDIQTIRTYIDNLQTSFENVSKIICTGNSIVDSILNEKAETARGRKIDMAVDVCLSQNIRIEAIDLCVILANSLDNAIEACDKVKFGGKREIKVYGRLDRGFLSFIISNTIAKSVYVVNNKIITDKLDKLNHGYGLQNISNSVRKNQGKMKIECQDELFTLYIDIPCRMN